jgi:hypothetical protein
MAMPEEEPLGRAASQIDRNTAGRADQACFVTFDERLESLAQQDCALIPECPDHATDI